MGSLKPVKVLKIKQEWLVQVGPLKQQRPELPVMLGNINYYFVSTVKKSISSPRPKRLAYHGHIM